VKDFYFCYVYELGCRYEMEYKPHNSTFFLVGDHVFLEGNGAYHPCHHENLSSLELNEVRSYHTRYVHPLLLPAYPPRGGLLRFGSVKDALMTLPSICP
jgi:hypothetical protein